MPVDDDSGAPLSQDSAGPGEFDPSDHSLLAALAAAPDPTAPEIEMTGQEDLADPDLIEDFVPGQPPQAAPQGLAAPIAIGVGARRSGSYTGMTEHGAKVAGGIFGKTDAEGALIGEGLDRQLAEQRASLESGYTKARQATAEMAAFDREHQAELSAIHAEEYDNIQTQAKLERMAQVHAQEEGESYMNAYKQEMQGVRQLVMQSGNPLADLGTAQSVGLGLAAAAQGFLAARYGINVNVTGQIDKWVDRELALHQQRVENQKGVAQSQLTLFDLARRGAQDEWEARQRLRGFVVDGVKAKLAVEAARWGSEVAVSEARMKIAKLDIDQAATDIGLQQKVTEEKHQVMRDETAKASAIARARTESFSASAEANYKSRMAGIAEGAAKAKEAPGDYRISDPTQTRLDKFGVPLLGKNKKPVPGGLYLWAVDHSQPSGTVSATNEKVAKYKSANDMVNTGLDELRVAYLAAKDDMKPFRNITENIRRYNAAKQRVVATLVRTYSGLASNKDEFERHASTLAADKLLQEGDNHQLIEDFAKYMRADYKTNMNSMLGAGLRLTTPEERTYEDPPVVNPAGEAQGRIASSKDGPVKTPIDEAVLKAVTLGRSRNTREGLGGLVDRAPSKAWAALMGDWTNWRGETATKQPLASEPIDALVKGVIDPKSYRAAHPGSDVLEDDGFLRGQLRNAIRTISESRDVESSTRQYADTILKAIESETLSAEESARFIDLFKD